MTLRAGTNSQYRRTFRGTRTGSRNKCSCIYGRQPQKASCAPHGPPERACAGMLFALACGHERPVADGRYEVARFRIDPKARFFYVSARGPLPRRFARRLDAHRPGSVVYVVVRLKNVQTCQRSSLVVNSCIQIPTRARASVHVVNRPGPRASCPCCGHRRVSHRSGGSGPSSGAMVRSHARRGRRTAPRIRRRAREIRAKHATSGFPRRHLLQIPPPQFRRDW